MYGVSKIREEPHVAPLCFARYVPCLNLSGREKTFPVLGVKFAGNRGNGYLKFAGEQKNCIFAAETICI